MYSLKSTFLCVLLVFTAMVALANLSLVPTTKEISELKAASIEGDPESQYLLAHHYLKGIPGIIEQDISMGIDLMKKSAVQDFPAAKIFLAIAVVSYPDLDWIDQPLAMLWLMTAADQKNVNAILFLAKVFENGRNNSPDPLKAMALLLKHAELPEIANELGEVYFRGLLEQEINYDKAMEHFMNSAEKDFPEGIKNVGKMYFLGRGREVDCDKAFYYMRRAAELDNLHAIYNMGLLYEKGCGVKQDDVKAFEWYKRASDLGHWTARYELACAYLWGQGVKKDERRAFELFHTMAQGRQHLDSIVKVAEAYRYGKGVEKNMELSFNNYLKASSLGKTLAKVELGFFYEQGIGTAKDIQAALRCYNEAAKEGNSKAKYKLGLLYERGKDVPKDYERAADFYRSAISKDEMILKNKPSILNAEKPYYKAFGALGRLHYHGNGVKKDLNLAIELLEKSAELDSLNAICLLAYIYENRKDGHYDIKKAIFYLKKAAEQDHVPSIFRLGTYNMIVTSDYEQALHYFRKGELLGHGESTFRLAYMTENGWGLPVNETAAKLKYAKADELGFSFEQQAEELRRYGR